MAGSNLVAVKRRLVEVLPGLVGIPFDFSYVGKRHQANRDGYGYLGARAAGPVAAAAMAGGTRFTRQESPAFSLAIEALTPGEETTEAVEALLLGHGQKVEEYLAGNWQLGQDIGGLLKVVITDYELEAAVDDDGATGTLAYTLQAESHVR